MGEVIKLRTRDSVLEAQIALDLFLILHYRGGPETLIDDTLAELKKQILETFYNRFPGQRPEE